MNLLKRLELWVLLAIIVAGLSYVFLSGPGDGSEDDGPGGNSGTPAAASDAPLKFHRAVAERDYGNVRLDLEVRVKNESADKLTLHAPDVRLLTSGGREIPSFFLAFDAIPQVPARTTQDVQLRYWLEAADLKQGLTLEVQGRTLEVKSSTPLDIESLKNGEKTTFTRVDWKP